MVDRGRSRSAGCISSTPRWRWRTPCSAETRARCLRDRADAPLPDGARGSRAERRWRRRGGGATGRLCLTRGPVFRASRRHAVLQHRASPKDGGRNNLGRPATRVPFGGPQEERQRDVVSTRREIMGSGGGPNNAEWCHILCRTHGVRGRFDPDAWVAPHRTPRTTPTPSRSTQPRPASTSSRGSTRSHPAAPSRTASRP